MKSFVKNLFLVVLCIASIFILSSCQKSALPYSLKPSMQEEEIKRAMKENGFQYDFKDDNHLYFKSKTVYGVRTDFTVVIYDRDNKAEFLSIKHFYEKLSNDQHATVLEGLTKEYGNPVHYGGYTSSVTGWYGGYKWTKGKVEIDFDDVEAEKHVVDITFTDYHY